MRTTVLVTAAGAMPGLAVINALKAQREVPVRVLAADIYPLCAGRYLGDAFVAVPPARSDAYLGCLLDVCTRHDVKIVFPILDDEQLVLSHHRGQFQRQGIQVIANEAAVVRLALDKYLTYQFSRANHISVPATFLCEDLRGIDTLELPVVLKPRIGRGAVGVFTIRDRDELTLRLSQVRDAIVQRFLVGQEYTIDVLTDFAGNLISVVPKARLSVKAGMQVKGCTVRDGRLLAYGEMIARTFNLRPRANIQCIDTEEGLFLVEVNPKFPASMPLTVAAGVNVPLLLVKMSLGHPVRPIIGQFRDGLLMLRYWQEIFVGRETLTPEDQRDGVFGPILAETLTEQGSWR